MALHQLWLARHAHLSPWCGGGFGMFSTVDGWGNRHLHAVALGPAFRTSLEVPPALHDAAEDVLALPTEERLRGFARALAQHAPRDLESPESIRIDVFARRYDRETLAARGERLRSIEITIDDPSAAR